jgi:hypothetical protein
MVFGPSGCGGGLSKAEAREGDDDSGHEFLGSIAGCDTKGRVQELKRLAEGRGRGENERAVMEYTVPCS